MASASLRLHDLGTLRVGFEQAQSAAGSVDASAAESLGGRKPTCILSALLVHSNRRVSRDVLAAAAWGDRPVEAASTLEVHIWRVRKVLEPGRRRGEPPAYLVNDHGGYRLTVNPDNADSLRFVQLAEQGDGFLADGAAERAVPRYESALGLWRGRPFEAVADQEWAAGAVARLVERQGQVREQHIEALLRIGQLDRAMLLADELTVVTPLRERVWGQLMLARYRAGRTEEALGTYLRARALLREELGLEPGPLLRDLHRRILDQDPTLSTPSRLLGGGRSGAARAEPELSPGDVSRPARSVAPAVVGDGLSPAELSAADTGPRPVYVELPRRLTQLFGREVELDRLRRLMRRTSLVTVVGPAGCGKTRLAIEAAHLSAAEAPDGVWFVDLTAIDDPAGIADTAASTIGLAAPMVGDSAAALRAYLQDRRVLLVLDNCEHLIPDIGKVIDELLGHSNESQILATSREPVGADGEVLWTLGPLAIRNDRDNLSGLPPQPGAAASAGQPTGQLSAAAQLFSARVNSLDPDLQFPRDDRDIEAAEAICFAVDGLPLAIELAAGRIRSASLAEIRAQASAGLADLSRIGPGRVDHHQTVERSIQWSVRLLSDAERVTHARLSVLPGVFTNEAAVAVVGVEPIQARRVPGLLAQLVHRSLLSVVRPSEPDQPTRYRQLATVRAHAAGLLAAGATGSEDARDTYGSGPALARRTGFILDLLSSRPSAEAPDTAGWYATVEDNHDTLTAVLQHNLIEQPDSVGVYIAGTVTGYWAFRDRWHEWDRWADLALRQPSYDLADRIATQLGYASFLALRGRPDLTPALLQDAIEHFDLLDRHWLVPLLVGCAIQVWIADGPQLNVIDEVIARRADGGEPTMVLYRDLLAARTTLSTGGPAAALASAVDVLSRALQARNYFAAWVVAGVGCVCAMTSGDPATGVDLLHQARRYRRMLGGSASADDIVLEFEGDCAVLAGDLDRAVRAFSVARAHAFRAGIAWPVSPITQPLLDRARELLPTDQFETAWRAGLGRDTDQRDLDVRS